jgi:hypothetical protein
MILSWGARGAVRTSTLSHVRGTGMQLHLDPSGREFTVSGNRTFYNPFCEFGESSLAAQCLAYKTAS